MATKKSKRPTRSAEGRTFITNSIGDRYPINTLAVIHERDRRRAAKSEAAKEFVKKSTKAYKRIEAISRKVTKTTPKSSFSKFKSSKGKSF